MMATTIIILACAALVHFIYDGIIAPSTRMCLRYEVFEQRDLLRELRCDNASGVDKETFDCLHNSLNNAICLVSSISITRLVQADSALDASPAMRQQIQKSRKLIRESPNEQVREIAEKTDSTISHALLINSFGLILWTLPILVALICFGSLFSWLKASVEKVIVAPVREIQRLFPMDHTIAA